MPISHVTTHHLIRPVDAPARLSLRTEELAPEGHSEELLNKLKSAFLGRISREHGSFTAEGAERSPLEQGLEAFIADGVAFSQLSTTLMEWLKRAVDEGKIDIDAHFLFFTEKGPDRHLFYLFVARQQESLAISEELNVTPSYAIDTGHSLFGIKVDLIEWKERGNYAYLSLLPPRGNPALTEAFQRLTGFGNGLDKAEATLAFLAGVDTFSKQLPAEAADQFRSQVVDYCTDREEQDEPVSLHVLAGSLEGVDTARFVKVMTEHAPEGQDEVMLDRRSLRRYVKFAGREKDLAVSFSSHQLNHRVQYDPERDTLSIHGLPRILREQLLRHLGSEG